MKVRVGILDYGAGNIASVAQAVATMGGEPRLLADPAGFDQVDRLILPGVGAFKDAMDALSARGLPDALHDWTAAGRPLLGICLGMQVLFERGEEFGDHEGLGLLAGRVRRIPQLTTLGAGLRVPHIGWNRLSPPVGRAWDNSILRELVPGDWTYFVHSYTACPDDPDTCLAETSYGGHMLCAAVRHASITGCQFHPEKSGRVGLAIIKAFLEPL
ncbi:imidazole glycerol phosphate synthase subunit HisH [Niveispirillum fermenti]|uniref:imidazole glycerol phosphate synthase subunit HisH n=1 Tax=Niveispirillum fermenti TaxID=1233113 RepID=UPI003A860A10